MSVGMEVKKGDILVSGSVPVYNEDATVKFYQYYDADADVYIRRQLRKKEELPLHYEKKEYTGEEKRKCFSPLWIKIWYSAWGRLNMKIMIK